MKPIQINKYGLFLFLTGFAALVYEIVFIKTLSLILGQSTYTFSVMLAAFMIGIGIGSLLAARSKGEPLLLFSLTQIGIAAYSIVFIPLLNKTSTPAFLIAKLPFFLQNSSLIILSLAMMIIPTTLMGLGFPLLAKHVVETKNDKKQIGRLFAYNTAGGLFGSLAAGFIFLPEFGVSSSLTIAAVINLSVAVSIKTKLLSRRVAVFIVLVIVMLSVNREIDPHVVGAFYNTSLHEDLESFNLNIEESRKSAKIIYSDFDLYGHVFVKKIDKFKFIYLNGKPDAGTSKDAVTELMIGYIPMFLHDNPKKVAVVGLGAGLTAGAALQFDINKVDIYEINYAVVEANKYFREESHHALSNPKTNLVMGDARRNLSLSGEIYDVIVSEPSNPWIEGQGFLFTKEFYEIVAGQLSKDGVFVQWLGAYDYSPEDFNILLNTLNLIFPHIQIWSEGTDFYIISSREPKKVNYSRMIKKLQEPTIRGDINLIGLIDKKALSPADIFFSYFVANYEETGETRINTDDNSIIEFSTARHSGQTRDHLKRLVKGNIRDIPVSLNKDDFDVDFKTNLPFYGSKYFFEQAGEYTRTSKEIAFKDKKSTMFVQTQIQDGPPGLAQAKRLAAGFSGVLTESTEHLYSFRGDSTKGVIGYCPDVKQFYLVYSTSDDPIIISCKTAGGEPADPQSK
jgi:predicted membrane-bound spermidine synthase